MPKLKKRKKGLIDIPKTNIDVPLPIRMKFWTIIRLIHALDDLQAIQNSHLASSLPNFDTFVEAVKVIQSQTGVLWKELEL